MAQFVSFGPDLKKRFHVIRDFVDGNDQLPAWIEALLAASTGHSVNVRTFRPGVSKATPFVYGLTSANEVVSRLLSLSDSGFYTIVNETLCLSLGRLALEF